MSYDYQTERPKLFSKEGLKLYTAIRDQARRLLKLTGAADLDHLASLPDGIGAADSWEMIACVDLMCENGDLKEVQHPLASCIQDRLFIAGKNWEREL